jgi:hypothetical protein
MAFAARAPDPVFVLPRGGVRDWPVIEAWAREIASQLREPVATA